MDSQQEDPEQAAAAAGAPDDEEVDEGALELEEQAEDDAAAAEGQYDEDAGEGDAEEEEEEEEGTKEPEAEGDAQDAPTAGSSGQHTPLQLSGGGAAAAAATAATAAAAAGPGLASGLRPGSTSSSISRPMSALRDLRGSRPNSAAIAAQIEGFDTDFQAYGVTPWDAVQLAGVPEAEAAVEGGGVGDLEDDEEGLGPSEEEALEMASQEHQHLLEVNEQLQRRVRALLDQRARGRPALTKDLNRLDGAEARYRSALKQWAELHEERDRTDASYQSRIFEAKAGLEGRIKRAEDISATFHHFRREVALAAEFSKSGRPLGERQLAQMEAADAAVEEEVQRVRLKNIHLANTLSKLEANIRAKEELAEGLHLIDFEQLKIENQSLNEKIEERNEELLKLRKKLTNTVQVLTHMKEKLQFVERENGSLTGELADVDDQLAGQRGALTALKATRDVMRTKQRSFKDTTLNITNPQLLRDMEKQRELCSDLQMELEQLKEQYRSLTGLDPPISSGGAPTIKAGRR